MKGENDMLDLDAKAIDLDDLIFHTEQKQEKKIDPNISPEGKKEQKPEKIKTKKKQPNEKRPEQTNETLQSLAQNETEKKHETAVKIKQTQEQKKEKIEISKTEENPIEEKKIESKKDELIIDNRLILGQTEKKNDVFIAGTSRYLNTVVIGTKGTGKTTSILPFFAEQDISKKIAGCTFIVSDKEMAYNLYSICKQYKRKVHLLKPSTNSEISNKFLWQTQYNYDYINESIINYKEAIRKKEIVIIDMEVFKYKLDAIRATAMLLLQLRLDLQDTDITQRHSHFLYVDDAYYYMAFLDDLLKYGATYNLGTTLFLESRNQLLIENKDYRNVVEDHVRNIILLNKISMEDYHYYKELFSDKIFDNFFSREITTLVFQSVDMKGQTRTGIAKMKQVNTINLDEIVKKAKKIRATLLKEKRKNRENELRESQYSHEPTPIDDELLKAIADETEYVPEQNMEIKKMKEEIREKIVEEEKVAKRKLAENIFNDYNRHVEFCDDLFKFS